MFSKLAAKNAARSLRDYSVYFITIAFGVCIFYVFNSMESQSVLGFLGGRDSPTARAFLEIIDVLSVFVSVVLAFLILYANTFMIRRRKKELGVYLLLGMPQGRVAALLFLETLLIGLLALGAGLVLGVLLSQFISVFTAGLFSVTVTEFYFVFSPGAVAKTLLYFGVIFLVVMVFNSLSVSRCRLITLLQADRTSQDLKLKSIPASVAMFGAGAALLITAYAMLLTRGLLRVDGLFWLMIGMGALGTLLFFRSLSGFLLRVCQASKGLYYKGLNMFILRQFNSKINTTYVSMTVICLMLLLAIGITACSVGLNNTIESATSASAPFDFSLQVWEGEEDLPALLTEAGFSPEEEAQYHAWRFYQVETQPLAMEDGQGSRFEASGFEAIALSDFNALMALQGRPALTLEEGRYGVLQLTEPAGRESIERQALARGLALEIGGSSYTPDPAALRTDEILTSSGAVYSMLILPDRAAAGQRQGGQCIAGNYRAADKEAAEAGFLDAMDRFAPGEGQGAFTWETRLNIYMELMGSKILVLFIGMYLGIIFLMTSAAVLALQQLSQAADNAARYQILARLGVEERERSRSIYVQVFLYFFLPLALAVVHAAVGMKAANAVIAEVGKVDAAASSAVTALFILVVYGAYFLATCWGSRRIVREGRYRQRT